MYFFPILKNPKLIKKNLKRKSIISTLWGDAGGQQRQPKISRGQSNTSSFQLFVFVSVFVFVFAFGHLSLFSIQPNVFLSWVVPPPLSQQPNFCTLFIKEKKQSSMMILMLWQGSTLLMLMFSLNDAAQASNVAFLTQLGNDWINKYKEQGNKSLSLAADWIHRKIYSFEEAFNWYISFQKDINQNMKICFYFDLKFLKTKGKEDTIYYYVSILPSSNDNNFICLV